MDRVRLTEKADDYILTCRQIYRYRLDYYRVWPWGEVQIIGIFENAVKIKHVFYQESVAIVAVLNYKSNKYLRNESTTHNWKKKSALKDEDVGMGCLMI